jgi:hypothetical protein
MSQYRLGGFTEPFVRCIPDLIKGKFVGGPARLCLQQRRSAQLTGSAQQRLPLLRQGRILDPKGSVEIAEI